MAPRHSVCVFFVIWFSWRGIVQPLLLYSMCKNVMPGPSQLRAGRPFRYLDIRISWIDKTMTCTSSLRSFSIILSRASGVGSQTNHPGSRQRQDKGPGILWSVHRWTKPNTFGGASNLRSYTKAPQDLTYYTDCTKTVVVYLYSVMYDTPSLHHMLRFGCVTTMEEEEDSNTNLKRPMYNKGPYFGRDGWA